MGLVDQDCQVATYGYLSVMYTFSFLFYSDKNEPYQTMHYTLTEFLKMHTTVEDHHVRKRRDNRRRKFRLG